MRFNVINEFSTCHCMYINNVYLKALYEKVQLKLISLLQMN